MWGSVRGSVIVQCSVGDVVVLWRTCFVVQIHCRTRNFQCDAYDINQ